MKLPRRLVGSIRRTLLVVLVPGMLGFVRLVLYPYWYGIIPALRRGGATVIAVQVSPVNSNEVRGEELLLQIEAQVP